MVDRSRRGRRGSLEDQRDVQAPKGERVGNGDLQVSLERAMRRWQDLACRVHFEKIQRGRDDAGFERRDYDDSLERSRSAKRVANLRLRR